MKLPLILCSLVCATLLPSCASRDNPTCRRVSAEQFMAGHWMKVTPSDQFLGTAGDPFEGPDSKKEGNAFKQIGWKHSWTIIWCPVSELPADYLKNAHKEPIRDSPLQTDAEKF